jgi:4-hydroxythreonine-4-phosphate dehydrogenase
MPEPAFLPRIAVTMGDPGGIGPEVIAKALAEPGLAKRADWRIVGPANAWQTALRLSGSPVAATEKWVSDWPGDSGGARTPQPGVTVLRDSFTTREAYHEIAHKPPTKPDAKSGRASFLCVADAIAMAKLPPEHPLHVDAIVTGPISKEAWKLAGHGEFPGHTEMLAAGFGIADGEFGMFFHAPPVATGGPALNVMLATVHVPLSRVPGMLTIGRVTQAIKLGHQSCLDLGFAKPRVAVCGLNPHAGENGVLGTEDDAVIKPAIEAARELGIDASGPHPGDTVFGAAVRGKYDLVVAMYHDQGLIPVKLLAFDRAVNVTVGLEWQGRRIIRTSPDHGTAFDIASGVQGKGVADPGSMKAAMELAVTLCKVARPSI